ncbi:MAG: DUF2244 domain-containing protein [Proteobacteria bacterium]|nr:DUF2244 domain-containing protein [Pseudomonadota bacterium]
MAITMKEAAGARSWIARPNCSLTPTLRRGVIALILAASLIVSTGFLLAGAWLVLPFAGLELLVLFIALRAIDRQGADYESIQLDDDSLIVSTRQSSVSFRQSFHAGWARISLDAADGPDPLLYVRSHGHTARVGRLLTADERRLLFSDLSRHLARPH